MDLEGAAWIAARSRVRDRTNSGHAGVTQGADPSIGTDLIRAVDRPTMGVRLSTLAIGLRSFHPLVDRVLEES